MTTGVDDDHDDDQDYCDDDDKIREGFRKITRIFMVFYHTGGRGVSEGSEKPYCFFQSACRIILGPPKHVLHLVWSPFVIYGY